MAILKYHPTSEGPSFIDKRFRFFSLTFAK